MTLSLHTRDALLALGFVRAENATLVAPVGTSITLMPIGAFVELRIIVDGSTEVRAILHWTALKVCRVGVKP